MTENHSYQTPGKGETDWHIPLNENFEAIDKDVEIRDTESALQNYTPTADAKFYATDTGAMYLGDGSSWNRASGSFSSVSTRDSPVINVESFGAVGDGSTDDRGAIKQAVDHAASLGGGVVYLPQGEYRVDDTNGESAIPLHHDNVHLKGAGPSVSKIRSHFNREVDYYGTNKHAALISAYGQDASSRLRNVHVSDLGIEIVDNFPDASIVGDFIEYSSITNVWVDNLTQLQSGATPGIPIWWGKEENEKGHNAYNSVRGCTVLNNADRNPGIEMSSTEYGVVADNVIDSRNGEAGIKVEGSRFVSVSGNTMTSAKDALNFLSTSDCLAIGNTISAGAKGIVVGGGADVYDLQNHTITGNTITANKTGVKMFFGAGDWIIQGNAIRDCETGIGLNTVGPGLISNNTIENVTTNAITNNASLRRAEGYIISNNLLHNSGAELIKILCPKGSGVNIQGNTLKNAGSGAAHLLVTDHDGEPVRDFIISNNHCHGNGNDISITDIASSFVVTGNLAEINYGGDLSSSEVIANNAS